MSEGCGDTNCKDPNCEYGKYDDAAYAEIINLRAQLASANELAERLQRQLDLEFDSYAKEGWAAKLASARKALQFIADGYENHDINHVDYRVKVYQVATETLEEIA